MEIWGIGILSSIIGGILATGLLFFVTVVWRDSFIPWIEDRIYCGIRINGVWDLQQEQNTEYWQRETLELEQKASRLSGRLVISPKEGETWPPRTLKVEGNIRDRFVVLTCTPSTCQHLGYQVLLAEVMGSGPQLVGQASYYDTRTTKVAATKVVYKKME